MCVQVGFYIQTKSVHLSNKEGENVFFFRYASYLLSLVFILVFVLFCIKWFTFNL